MIKFPWRSASKVQTPWFRAAEENISTLDTDIRSLSTQISATESNSSAGILAFERQTRNFDDYLQNIVKTETQTLRIPESALPEQGETANFFMTFPFVQLGRMDINLTGGAYLEYGGAPTDYFVFDIRAAVYPWDSSPIDPQWTWWDLPYTAATVTWWVPDQSPMDAADSYTWTSSVRLTNEHVLDELQHGIPVYDPETDTYLSKPVEGELRAVVAIRLQMEPTFYAATDIAWDSQISATAISYPQIFRGEGI